MQYHFPILFENIPDETIRLEKLFFCQNMQFIVEEDLGNLFAIVTIRVLSNQHLFTKRVF
jgi:hypothetical protein